MRIGTFLRGLAAGVAALAALAFTAGDAAAQRTRLTVYTAIENEQLAPFKAAIEAAVPQVEIAWVRDSTGVITSRFLAEAAQPRADMILGLSGSSMALFALRGLLEPYTPAGADQLRANFRSPGNPLSWVGLDAYLAAVCFNTAEGARANAPVPRTWADLLNPAYRGQIVMPNPASSGTGYLTVAAWLQTMGEEGGWRYMDRLHENVAVYLHSGSAPCVQAARGERMIGIGFDMRAASEKTRGAPIEIVMPTEGVGWEMEAAGIVRGRPNVELARRVMDWAVTREANVLYSQYYAVVGRPDVTNLPPNYPAAGIPLMVNMDLGWMANERERILAEWTRRYGSRSAPR